MNKLLRLYHTVKFLKTRQVIGQFRNRLRSKVESHGRFLAQAVPGFDGCSWPLDIEILPPGMQINTAPEILDGRFIFLNDQKSIGWLPDWQCKEQSKLWQYNLHYFEWLWALDYEDAKAAALDWISNHQLAKSHVGWEPYPVSLRLMNLCGVFFSRFRRQTLADESFTGQLWQSIYRQCQWLMGHLEVHLLGNHYFENAAALAFVSSCFQGQAAQQWLDIGLEILQKEIPEQILSDGMHFELSPMYHSRMLYLMAILTAGGNKQLVDLVKEPLNRMLQALKCLCHPDGRIALLNDSAFGIYNQPKQLLDYCSKVSGIQQKKSEPGAFSLPDAGYYGWRDRQGNYLICDAGNIGPDYILGHAHADIFSFELSLKGHRVIVDAGVYDYVDSDMRRYCRSTAAHNTIEIDGHDQCQMWSSFRVARRGYPKVTAYTYDKDGFELSGRYVGYKRLKDSQEHLRSFIWKKDGGLTVADEIKSASQITVRSRLHLHPSCSITNICQGLIEVAYPAGVFTIKYPAGNNVNFEKSTYLPEFGKCLENDCIVFIGSGNGCKLSYSVMHLRD